MRKGKKALLLLTMTACLAFGSEVSAEMTSKGTTGTGAYSTYGTTTNRSGNAGTMSGYGTGTYDTNNYRAYNDNNYRTYALKWPLPLQVSQRRRRLLASPLSWVEQVALLPKS
jgi:hypothetical protein